MERTAVSRAWDYLNYSPTAKWLAVLCAAASGALYVALVLVLALFANLITTGGRIPAYADLSDVERQNFRHDWQRMKGDDRENVAGDLNLTLLEASRVADAEYHDVSTEELRWKAYVTWVLHERAGAEAADAYRNPRAVAGGDPVRPRLGALNVVLRMRHYATGHILGLAARVCPWMWEPAGNGDPNRPYLTGLLILAALIATIRVLLVIAMNDAASLATLGAVARIRRLIYHHANRLGSLAVSDRGPTEAVGTFTREVENVHDGLYSRLTVAVREPVKFVLLAALALAIHAWLGLAFLCAALLVWLLGRQVATYFRRQGRVGVRRATNQLTLLQESLQMMRLVKGYLMDLFNQARVERQLSEYTKSQVERFRGEAVARPLVIFFGTLAAAGLLFVAGWVVLTGGLSAAGLVTMGVALVSLYFPVDNWMAQRRLVHRAEAAAVGLFEFLDRRPEVGQVVGAEFLNPMSREMQFEDVSLREPGTGRMLLNGASLTIRAGQRVAIVGADDAERHALAALIPRFLDPSSGEIRIDGKNVRWVTLDSLRNQVALVMQQNLIFNDTVANNIGCGDPSYSIPQIIEAAKLVHAHNFIQKLPFGYETPIGQLGHSLSIGQQFRIALARAVLRDPAILIIEEPDAELDEGSREMIDDAYARMLPERTVIFVPHRLSTLKSCDRVFLLHNGKLEAEGEHREMLQENELYRHLYYMEYNMFANRL